MFKRHLAVAGAVAALSLVAAGCGDDDNEPAATGTTQEMTAGQDIVALAQGNRDLSTLVDAVTAADLGMTLQGEGPFTVFAPTNAAFQAVGQDTLQSLLRPANKDQLASVLTYHVVEGKLNAADLRDGQTLETVQGQRLRVRVSGDTVRVGDARVVQADVDASNGVVHVIDGVLQPTA
jgi:uncharacterized surface protein with fasciclin (FAS1) repeats